MQKRILVAEDDSLQRYLISMFLGWHDYDVHTASNGAEAVRKCLGGGFNVVLMDYKMPIVDGHSAAKLIMDFTRGKASPNIIALTSAPERLREDEADADSVFAAIEGKPWDPQSLLETIEQLEKSPPLGEMRASTAAGRAIASGTMHSLPVLVPDMRREIALLDGQRPPGPVRVLVVEDDELVRSLLSAALDARQYEVETASNGLEAIGMLEHGHYDVALMDYRLPKIDGLVTAQLVQDLLPRLQRPRFIALTSAPELLRERDTGRASAFDAIVPKSSDMQYVVAAIERSVSYQAQHPVADVVNAFAGP